MDRMPPPAKQVLRNACLHPRVPWFVHSTKQPWLVWSWLFSPPPRISHGPFLLQVEVCGPHDCLVLTDRVKPPAAALAVPGRPFQGAAGHRHGEGMQRWPHCAHGFANLPRAAQRCHWFGAPLRVMGMWPCWASTPPVQLACTPLPADPGVRTVEPGAVLRSRTHNPGNPPLLL